MNIRISNLHPIDLQLYFPESYGVQRYYTHRNIVFNTSGVVMSRTNAVIM